jgi:hypothetical protein
MPGKRLLAALAMLMLSLTSGCRLCERWYEREHDPYDNRDRDRPRYWTPPPNNCVPNNCAPQQPCPPGYSPAYGGNGYAPGYGSGYTPSGPSQCGCW